MISQQEIEEFKMQMEKAIKEDGGTTYIDQMSLARIPAPFLIHVYEMIKTGEVKIVWPGPSQIF